MEGNINAIGIIIIPILTAILLIKYGSKPNKLFQIIIGILITLIALCGNPQHLCYEGQSFYQSIIPSICLLISLLFIKPKIIRWVTAVIILITMFYLINQYNNLVHGNNYTGNPKWRKKTTQEGVQDKLQYIKIELETISATNNTTYPAGWLSDLEIKQLIPQSEQFLLDNKSVKETYKFWHTPITRLYGVTYQKVDIWYPGGLLKDSINKLEVKER
ncbi:MAG: hypothetical protein V1871_04395 [Planctomycetota bacterium]